MSKVLVDRELLERCVDRWACCSIVETPGAEQSWLELRAVVKAVQPEDVEGVEIRRYTPISQGDHIPAMNSCDQGGWVRHSDHLAALSAVTAKIEAVRRDAERYRWLRMADWWNSPLCVIRDPKQQAKPGTDCPSRDRLDAVVDDAMQQS